MIFPNSQIIITNNEHIFITLIFFIFFGLIGYTISQYFKNRMKRKSYIIQSRINTKHIPADYQLFSIESSDNKYDPAWK